MSLRTCPKCNHRVLTFGRFLLESMSLRKLQCPGCKAALSLAFGYSFLPLIIVAAIFMFGTRPLLKTLLPTSSGIPFGVAVALILVFFILFKGIIYLFADWRIKEVNSN